MGTALAARDGHLDWPVAGGCLAGVLLIQIGTNLANDGFDFERGADREDRVGPKRAAQQGWLSSQQVLAAAEVAFALASLVGSWLAGAGGWPIAIMGIASLVVGWTYTGGRWPLSYHGLGEVFVLAFLGCIAVTGTYYAQALVFSGAALLAGVGVGALGVALLAVNNLRDRATDERAGKRTLVVRFGEAFGRAEYLAAVGLALAVPEVMVAAGLAPGRVLVTLLAAPFAVAPARLVLRTRGTALNGALTGTARLLLVYGALFCAASWR